MKKYYKIGEISKLYSISPDSLRYYEDLGILKPKRDVNGYRMYSINDIWTLNILRELRTIGFSMEQIKEHLLSYDLKSTLGLFSDAIDVIDKKTAELSALRAQLSERIDEIKRHQSSDKPKNKITVQYYPERHVLKLSEDVYRDDEIDFVIKKLQSEYEDQLYIIGYGDIGSTIPLEELQEGRYGHFDSAFYIVDPEEEYDDVLPSGSYLSMIVGGSYAQMAFYWEQLLSYARSHDLEPVGKAIELYLIDNHDTSDEDEYVTQIQIRINGEERTL